MIRATILGCGSSGGVPRIGGKWGDCDPHNPRNRRRRCALLVDRIGPQGTTRILIDTGPDLVMQLLDANVSVLDAILWTHPHADHIHGIDDLRQVSYNADQMLPGWADIPTSQALMERFEYVFRTPEGSYYPPIVKLNTIDGPLTIRGDGGPVEVTPFTVEHGNIPSLGFKFDTAAGGIVYLPDVSDIPDAAWQVISKPEVFICDALRRTPHPSHSHLSQTLGWIEKSAASHAVITNMHLDMDYEAVDRDTPDHIVPAYDGLVITCEAAPE